MLTENSIPQHRSGVGKTQLLRKYKSVVPSVRTSKSQRNRGLEIASSKAPEGVATGVGPSHNPSGEAVGSSPTHNGGVDSAVPVDRAAFAPPVISSRVVVIVGDASGHTAGSVDATVIDEAPVDDARADDAPRHDVVATDRDGDASRHRVARTARNDDGHVGAAHVGDDFWTGAASEESVPTRQMVYGARPTSRRSRRRYWIKSLRRP